MRIGQLALTVLVTWLIVERLGPGLQELRALDSASWVPAPVPLLGATLLLLAAYFVSAALWGLLVRDLGGPDVPMTQSVQIFMIANLGRYIPGKVWQIAGLAALAKARGVPVATATGAAVLGQGIALAAAAAIGATAFFAGPPPYPMIGRVAVVAIAAGVVLISIPRVFAVMAGWWFKLARTEAPPAIGSVHGLLWLGSYVANWAMYAASFWLLSVSLGLGGGLLPVASAFAAAYVLGYLMIFAPAGLGPREGLLIVFLTPHLGPGPSGLIAIVARVWTTVVEVVPAALFWGRHVRSVSAEGQGGE